MRYLIVVALLLPVLAWADEEHREAGTVASGTWTDPTESLTDDNVRATHANGDGIDTLYHTNFGFTIPAGATIDSLYVHIQIQGSASQPVRRRIVGQFVADGSSITGLSSGNSLQGAQNSDTDFKFHVSGNPTWATNFDVDSINGSGFGILLWNSVTQAGNNSIDSVSVSVIYTPAAAGPTEEFTHIHSPVGAKHVHGPGGPGMINQP